MKINKAEEDTTQSGVAPGSAGAHQRTARSSRARCSPSYGASSCVGVSDAHGGADKLLALCLVDVGMRVRY